VEHRRSRRIRVLTAFVLVACASAPVVGAQPVGRPTRVLVLYQQQAETQPMVDFAQSLRSTISEDLRSPVEFYQEALDLDRFTGRDHSSSLTEYFAEKYQNSDIDVIVPVGSRALQFAVGHLGEVLPNVPVVFALCAAPQTDLASLPKHVTGRLSPASRFAPTLWMARRLQPDAERIVVIGGSAPADSAAVSAVVSAVGTMGDSLELTVLQGLSLDVLLPRLRHLPRRSIVVFANYRQDAHGKVFEPMDIVGSIARATSAPIYTQLASYLGEGFLGGSVVRFDDEGVRTARLVGRVLRRRPGDAMPPVEPTAKTFAVDWRQLRRFGLSEALLPPGTELVFQEPTMWQRYRVILVVSVAVISAELFLTISLLLERRRRKHAQFLAEEQLQRAEETRRQVAHMGRVALVGELAATIAHELRQPLAAIRANAETGVKLIALHSQHFGDEDLELCGEIFSSIVADDVLASDIITRVRALVRREELPQRLVDLNETCRTSARLLQYDAHTRHVQITLALDPELPGVTGDPVQFQQVVLNLMMNALEASAVAAHPHVVVTSAARDDAVELEVRDNGPGFQGDVAEHLFESFFTTKPHGLGLGLVIVQSIVERYRGRVRAEHGEPGGAVFRVMLPRSNAGVRASEARTESVETESPVSSASLA
jgi:signal transduction histidine kinase